ncbi:AAA family ATPase [Ktedonospora formicarum]|uniref:Orc1-like AAA ATPase domain-containing protein n=1 Tax=Ktedonospora formicarum TaxID=2778364 RepID=A0A8J3MZ90_9CHLR|nr:AAA family ATPase [Ktedonospora formicarum]GHO50540.1 hypothetical protein KSX_87030 [Ktedonospora formicarum]
MPKLPAHVLLWSTEHHLYFLDTPNHPSQLIIPENEEAWRAWLMTHSSFSFQGQHGHLNVLKEFRARGTGYWYAYRTSSGRNRKRYLGTSTTLTLERLEEIAQALQESEQRPLPTPTHAPPSIPYLQSQSAEKDVPFSQGEQGRIDTEARVMMAITRLAPPRLPATLVNRERLLSILESALTRPLTILSASAGWGKTTLLSTWAHSHQEAVAWLSLEPLDNDPMRFWISIIAALRRCRPEIGARALALLHSPESLSLSVTTLLNELADQHAETTSPILLILDDYHVIDESMIHASLTFWLEHLPPYVHLLLASRIDPDLPLPAFVRVVIWKRSAIPICALRGKKRTLFSLNVWDSFSQRPISRCWKRALRAGLPDSNSPPSCSKKALILPSMCGH